MADDKYLKILNDHWGYNGFRGIQREIIESICAGKDTLGLMPTGGGKSITFQVPALAMDGVCLVVTPLIALMKDQVEHLRKKGIKAYAIYGSMRRDEILKVLDNAVLGGVTLLYISPERLSSELFLTKLRHIKVSFVTVDEAHCISQWGYDFRPSYLSISEIRKLKPEVPILALTATAPPLYIDDIQKQLGFRQPNVFKMSFLRKNLSYIVRETDDKEGQMLHILNSVAGCAIVYVYSRNKAKDTARVLNDNGISATFYHAGLDHTTRDERQSMWQEGKVRVMVATNAFGMGIDKPDVRMVIHTDCPDSIEAYFQEAGRAGRDGERAYAVLLYNSRDTVTLRRRVVDSFPDKDYIVKVYDHLAYFFQLAVGSGAGRTFEFSIDNFCKYFHHFPTRVEAALKILERSGYIEYGEDSDKKARIRFIIGRNDLYRINDLSRDENTVIITLLRSYSGLFSDYAYIDESFIAKETGLNEGEAYQILKGLDKKHIVSFIPRKDIPRIRYTQDRVDSDEVAIPRNYYEQRKDLFKRRIEAMIKYAENDSLCRSSQLLGYFGETSSKECGICDICLDKKKNVKGRTQDSLVRKSILKLLDDGKPHAVAEFQELGFPTELINRIIENMEDEETISNQNGELLLNREE